MAVQWEGSIIFPVCNIMAVVEIIKWRRGEGDGYFGEENQDLK